MANRKPAPEAPPINIKFIGKPAKNFPGKPDLTPEPLRHINDDTAHYVLPEPDAQRAGFFHPHAANIVRLFPDLYKMVRPKG